MHPNRYFLTLGTALLFAPTLTAQISFGGRPTGLKAEKLGLREAASIDLPAVDAQALLAEDAERAALGIKGPFRFGFNHTVDLSLDNSGTWSELSDGSRLWRVRLHCPQAVSINFVFGEYVVPEGGRVFVYNEGGAWLGAFTQASSDGSDIMGVTQLEGEMITVEYEEPAAVAGQGRLRITQVTHAYRDVLGLMKGLGDSGACNNNVICPEGDDWRDEIASVAMITVGGSGICTGSLINNCANDGTPYFLTANHCTSGGNVGSWVFRFNWESPTCATTTNGPTNQTVSGSTLLVNSAGSDVALLELNTTPPESYNVYYSGWDASGNAPTSTTCIHHPSGDIKKISFEEDASTQSGFGGAACWHVSAWDDGTTEPGSSGSGLWDQDHHLIGQLYGGEANCSNNVNDYFGRFDVSFPLLDDWLGNCGTVLDGWGPNSTPLGLDASIPALSGIEDSYCGSNTISPVFTLKNVGTTTITSISYSYNLDGGTNTTATWTGNLAQGEQEDIALGPITATNGSHTFYLDCTSPNGGTDENMANNSRSKDFFVADPGVNIELNITLDDYGSETTWELADEDGNTLFTGGPYTDDANGTVVNESFCVSEACYILTMNDSYGDGLCCEYGDGDYEVTDSFGNVLVNGNGVFQETVETPFCAESVGVHESASPESVRIFPNPGNGEFHLLLPPADGKLLLRVRDMLGREVWHSAVGGGGLMRIDLSELASGQYALEVIGAAGRALGTFTIAR